MTDKRELALAMAHEFQLMHPHSGPEDVVLRAERYLEFLNTTTNRLTPEMFNTVSPKKLAHQ